jgi:cyclopropane fatty-acyl-phospholipid synthase-like methyltransferase
MAEFRELYSHATIYDAVFDRLVDAETAFMRAVYEDINGRQPVSFLEVACGPGYHARQMSRDGLMSVGFDLEEAMIELAQKEAVRENLDTTFEIADMRKYRSAHKFDLAGAMLDGIDSLVSYEDLRDHLVSIAQSLKSGGLYILDNMHPREVNVWHYSPIVYEGEKQGLRARISYGLTPPDLDPIKQIATTETLVEVWQDDEYSSTSSTAVERFITPQELAFIGAATDAFELVTVYGNYDLSAAFDDPSADRMIIVLQKKG